MRVVRLLRQAALMLLMLLPVRLAAQPPLVLVDEGVATSAIVLPQQPSALESFAAQELADYLARMSGAQVPIVHEDETGRPAGVLSAALPTIRLGRTVSAEGLQMGGTPAQRENREAFRVLRRDHEVVICGNQAADGCDYGTLYGVWRFLELQGVGWYLPDPLGEVIPDQPTLSVGELDLTDAPSIGMRWGGMPAERIINFEQREGYLARSRPAGGRQVWFSHMFYRVLTPEVLAANPEFTEQGLCMTNPKLRQLFVDFTREQFLSNPQMYASSLFPDDNEGPTCGCEACQALLSLGRPEQTWAHQTSKSDYLVDFYNAVARGLEEEFPDRKVIGAAYVSYLDPPVATRVHPNVIILLTPLTDTGELHPALDGIVQGWRDMGAEELYWYGYLMGDEPKPHEVARRFRNYRRWNLQGVYLEQRPTFAVSGINYYLARRLAWDWNAQVDDLVEEFCYGLFGPQAGRLMVNFWYAWEQKNYTRAGQLIEAAEALVADDELRAQRVRYFKLGLQMVTSGQDMASALKAANLAGALEAARQAVAARDAVNADYGPGLRYAEWDHYGRYVGAAEQMRPLLAEALTLELPQMPLSPPAPGPLRLLTDNADGPAELRLDSGATVSYDVPPNDPTDYPETRPSKLFNGNLDGGWNNTVGVWGARDGVWTVTIDLQQEYEIQRVEVGLRKVPVYVDVLAATDGTDFQIVDRLFPRGLDGWHRGRDLGVRGRYVRLRLVSGRVDHQLNEVKIWGRELGG